MKCEYTYFATLAENTGQPVFGVKSRSLFTQILNIPSDVIIDLMFRIHEGVVKVNIDCFLNSKHRNENFYSGRRRTVPCFEKFIRIILRCRIGVHIFVRLEIWNTRRQMSSETFSYIYVILYSAVYPQMTISKNVYLFGLIC